MTRPAVALLVVACAVCACERSAPSGTLTPVASSLTVPTPTGPAACSTIVQRFHERRIRATGACANDSDCGCFNGVDPDVACGGVTDATSAKDLAAIEADFQKGACKFSSQCAPWACKPKCESGKCVR